MRSKYLVPVMVLVIVLISGLIIYLLNPGNFRNLPEANTTISNPQEPSTLTTSTNSAIDNPSDAPITAIVDYTVEMSSYAMSPNELEGEPGETIRIELVSLDSEHDFVIDELNVQSSVLGSGNKEVIEITIPTTALSGTEYVFYCSIMNHRALGMQGVLRVR